MFLEYVKIAKDEEGREDRHSVSINVNTGGVGRGMVEKMGGKDRLWCIRENIGADTRGRYKLRWVIMGRKS